MIDFLSFRRLFIASFIFFNLVFLTNLRAAPGDLDTSFGSGGYVESFLASSTLSGPFPSSMGILSDDRIIMIGRASTIQDGSCFDWDIYEWVPCSVTLSQDVVMNCLDTNGVPCTNFGTNGLVVSDLNSQSQDTAYSAVVQSDDKIVVAGKIDKYPSVEVFVARYNADGTLDSTFGSSGYFDSSVLATMSGSPLGNGEPDGIALQSDGKIVVVGFIQPSSSYNAFILRLNSDGTVDTTFGSGAGYILTSQSNTFNSVAIQSDGKIVVVGSNLNSGTKLLLSRYNSDGSIDTSFGSSGIVHESRDTFEAGISLAIDGNGNIVVGGNLYNSVGYWFVERFDTNGALDTTFNSNTGVNIINPGGDQVLTYLNSLILDDAENILVGGGTGHIYSTGAASDTSVLIRLAADGTIDTNFGTNGYVTHSLLPAQNGGYETILSVKLQSDGKIDFGGFSHSLSASDQNFQVGRVFGNEADVSVQVEGDKTTALVGDSVRFTVTVTNNGPQTSGRVLVSDDLPASLEYVNANPSSGSCSGTSSLRCQLGTIENGGSRTVTIDTTALVSGEVVNTIQINAGRIKNNSTNTQAQASVNVSGNGGSGEQGGQDTQGGDQGGTGGTDNGGNNGGDNGSGGIHGETLVSNVFGGGCSMTLNESSQTNVSLILGLVMCLGLFLQKRGVKNQ